ncbi:hypothetical protein ANN_04832 [Periplaneta americana]|uniref:Uncharacterized protein n=1 Tax=Periplaneta americana TaxID=6978 RepID=A0ABQ8TBB9_PERAM|nr:hypothetical protein ANN_04832 [Periplaneta americana]
MRCFDAFSSEQKKQIISRIKECDNKNDQDSYLQCLIQYHAVERHRSRNKTTESTPKPKTYSYEYYVKSGVKYDFFVSCMHENFNIGFGQPQVDVCSYCEEMKTKLRIPALCDAVKRVAAGELSIHNRRAKKFYHKMQEVQQLCKERDDVAGFVSDYMSNLPLPHIPVQEIFYYRQLWVYEFCIHNLKSGEA